MGLVVGTLVSWMWLTLAEAIRADRFRSIFSARNALPLRPVPIPHVSRRRIVEWGHYVSGTMGIELATHSPTQATTGLWSLTR